MITVDDLIKAYKENPALMGLVMDLPTEPWTAKRRQLFLTAVERVLDFKYPVPRDDLS